MSGFPKPSFQWFCKRPKVLLEYVFFHTEINKSTMQQSRLNPSEARFQESFLRFSGKSLVKKIFLKTKNVYQSVDAIVLSEEARNVTENTISKQVQLIKTSEFHVWFMAHSLSLNQVLSSLPLFLKISWNQPQETLKLHSSLGHLRLLRGTLPQRDKFSFCICS